eukprot:tig00000492_g1427.t1
MGAAVDDAPSPDRRLFITHAHTDHVRAAGPRARAALAAACPHCTEATARLLGLRAYVRLEAGGDTPSVFRGSAGVPFLAAQFCSFLCGGPVSAEPGGLATGARAFQDLCSLVKIRIPHARHRQYGPLVDMGGLVTLARLSGTARALAMQGELALQDQAGGAAELQGLGLLQGHPRGHGRGGAGADTVVPVRLPLHRAGDPEREALPPEAGADDDRPGAGAKLFQAFSAFEKLSACTPGRPYYIICEKPEEPRDGLILRVRVIRFKEEEPDDDIVGDIASEPIDDTPPGFEEAVKEGRWASSDKEQVQFRFTDMKHVLNEDEIDRDCYFCGEGTRKHCITCHLPACDGCSGLTLRLSLDQDGDSSRSSTPAELSACTLAAFRPMGFFACGREGAPAALRLGKLDREAGGLDCIFCRRFHSNLDDDRRPFLPLVISGFTREGIESLPTLGLAFGAFCAYEEQCSRLRHAPTQVHKVCPDQEAMNNRFIGYMFSFCQRPVRPAPGAAVDGGARDWQERISVMENIERNAGIILRRARQTLQTLTVRVDRMGAVLRMPGLLPPFELEVSRWLMLAGGHFPLLREIVLDGGRISRPADTRFQVFGLRVHAPSLRAFRLLNASIVAVSVEEAR